MQTKTVIDEKDLRIEKIEPGESWANGYLLTCRKTGESVLIDAPGEPEPMIELLRDRHVRYILMTHNHGDHIGALAALKAEFKLKVMGHELDAHKYPVTLDLELADDSVVAFGNHELKVMHTPGHTRGSLCFLTGKCLLAGDTIFPHGPGHTVTAEGFRQIIRSLEEKIFVLPDDTLFFPGHGDGSILWKEKDEYQVFASKPHVPGLHGDVLWLVN